jgi:hypothetical protein
MIRVDDLWICMHYVMGTMLSASTGCVYSRTRAWRSRTEGTWSQVVPWIGGLGLGA